MNQNEQLEHLLDIWEDAREEGKTLSAEEICSEMPEFIPLLQEKIDVLCNIDARIKSDPSEEVTIDSSQLPHGSDTQVPQHFENSILETSQKYEGVQFHARGGLGSVYMAQDTRLHREVALKFLHRRFNGNEELKLRFFIEAEVTSRLQHPGVVPVHGVGQTDEGRPFYAMRFIEGDSLEEAIQKFHLETSKQNPQEQRIAFHNLLSRFVSVCQTIAYAHNCGIVHRDIKPDNIMLGRFGETLVVDWGLAIAVGRDERAKASGEHTLIISGDNQTSNSQAGTPAYMSPEQHMEAEKVFPASDIYSLGVTLYKLLTGKTPFVARKFFELKQKIFNGDFQSPRQINPAVPKSLEAVCLKAMSAKSEERYGTALELAEDITRYLDDLPVLAKPESWTGHAFRWMRRHRASSIIGLTSLVIFSVASVMASIFFGQLANSEHESRVNAQIAEVKNLQLSSQFAARTIASEINQRWLILEREANSKELVEQVQKINANPDDKEPWKALKSWVNGRFSQHHNTVNATSWFIDSQDGTQVARAPYSPSIGKNWRYRNYFHGRGKDSTPEEAEEGQFPPIQNVHLSNPFRSRSTNTLMVAFTVPIWSHEVENPKRKVIGVLGLSLELGKFKSLEGGLVLVDTKEDWITQKSQRGRILHHGKIKQSPQDPESHETDVPRIDDVFLQKLIQFEREAALQKDTTALPPSMQYNNYIDPFSQNAKPISSACTPVLIPGRSNYVKRTGWIVIVPNNINHE